MGFDIFAAVTDRIIDELEKGTVPWKKPWVGTGNSCISYSTGRQYSLLNCILLGMQAGEFITFQQALQAGGHVKKGEKSRIVVFWKPMEKENPDTGEIETHFILRYYNVFHLSQCEGIQPRWRASMITEPGKDLKPDERAEKVIRGYVDRSGVKLTIQKGDKAYYQPASDQVVVPLMSQYGEQAEYYSTLLHELTHSTGHVSRLNRLKDVAAFGSHDYSREELVAELGSAFLMNHVGLETTSSFSNSAAYIQGWLSALKNDKRLVVSAAGAAEKAVKYILGEQEVTEE